MNRASRPPAGLARFRRVYALKKQIPATTTPMHGWVVGVVATVVVVVGGSAVVVVTATVVVVTGTVVVVASTVVVVVGGTVVLVVTSVGWPGLTAMVVVVVVEVDTGGTQFGGRWW